MPRFTKHIIFLICKSVLVIYGKGRGGLLVGEIGSFLNFQKMNDCSIFLKYEWRFIFFDSLVRGKTLAIYTNPIFKFSDNNHVTFPHMIFSAISKNTINYKKPNLPYIGIIITIIIIWIVSDYLWLYHLLQL